MTKGRGSEKNISPNQNTVDTESLKAKTNTELLAAIDDMLARPAEEVDGDFVEACLDILQDRAPVEEEFDPRAALDRLHREGPALFEEEPPAKVPGRRRGRFMLRYGGIAAAAVLCLVVTANAFGYNPIQAFFRWVNDTVQIYSNPSGVMELPPDDPSEYHSLEEALEACGADTADRITWIPKDYSVVNVWTVLRSDFLLVAVIYGAERGEMAVRIIDTKGSDVHGVAESDSDLGGSSYEKNGTVYYITSNYELTKAGWNDGKYSYVISGQISEDEMKKILDSIT